MVEVLAHRGWWVSKKDRSHNQNTWDSVLDAFRKKCGVEIDIRLTKDKKVYLSHDVQEHPTQFLGNILSHLWSKYTRQKRFLISLHIKEDTPEMFQQLIQLIRPTSKYIFFGLSEHSKRKYAKVFGWSRVAYEWETGRKGNLKEAIRSNSMTIWVSEFEFELTSEDYKALKKAGKKIYQVTPEITGYPSPHNVSGFLNKCKYLTGLCTDVPNFYANHKFTKGNLL